MESNNKQFVIITHLNGMILGEYVESNMSEITVKSAVSVVLDPNNYMSFSPMVPKEAHWDETELKEAVTVLQKRFILTHVILPMSTTHELCNRFNDFWENED